MDSKSIISKIQSPETLVASDERGLSEVIETYPYFQAVQALHLKLLKKEDSFEFKKYLRRAALHTTNRSLLFDFINRDLKEQEANAQKITKLEKDYLIEDNQVETISEEKTITKVEKKVEYTSSETTYEKHSFTEWLNLTKLQPLKASEEKDNPADEEAKTLSKDQLIEKFIKTNPKISNNSQSTTNSVSPVKTAPSQQMMTETLANIYFEQKKYDKAIQAYNILILNNPKKSSFFANQIKKIESLQENK
jgi:tetratricopeptide (TPR) repeat protein